MDNSVFKLDVAKSQADQDNFCDDFVTQLIQSGVDLRNYAANVNRELRKVENGCVGDYIQESSNIAKLHQQITQSDDTLQRIEEILCSFQSNLESICQDILDLQERSGLLNRKLKNQQSARSQLGTYLNDLLIPEAVITHILDTPAQEKEFMDQLHVLDAKLNFFAEQTYRDAKSCQDLEQLLESLKQTAVAKIFDYVRKKLAAFRRPMSNYQIPQTALLQKKFFFTFLTSHSPTCARQLLVEYVDTFSKVYFSYFKEYVSKLSRLRFEEQPDKDDLLAAEDGARSRGATSFFSTKPTALRNRATTFTLGNRAQVIGDQLEAVLIVPHAMANQKCTMEAIFRSHQYALVDNACREFLFIQEFFSLGIPETQSTFAQLFNRTTQFALKNVENDMITSFDCIGVFLCLHIVYRFRLLCHKRAVPALDAYWEQLVKHLWPRFEQLLQAHINSVRTCDIYKLAGCDTRPHFIARRYAEFSAALVAINDTFPDERVSALLAELQIEVENFILKMASRFDSPKEQLVFLINNYDIILSVLLERIKEENKESEKLKAQLVKRTHDLVEELLYPHFGQMISFVKDCEAYAEKADEQALSKEEKKVAPIIRQFNNGWRKAIEDLNREVMENFTNFKCGNNVQQCALKEVIQYYHRFHRLVSQPPFKKNPAISSLINVHQLMVEIKKYKSAF